jgi:hypothetical protein
LNVVTPITAPSVFRRGPPLFPVLIVASNWMIVLPESDLMALTIPFVTVPVNPSGFPIA